MSDRIPWTWEKLPLPLLPANDDYPFWGDWLCLEVCGLAASATEDSSKRIGLSVTIYAIQSPEMKEERMKRELPELFSPDGSRLLPGNENHPAHKKFDQREKKIWDGHYSYCGVYDFNPDLVPDA